MTAHQPEPAYAVFDPAACPVEELYVRLGTSAAGLTEAQAREQLLRYGPNGPPRAKRRTAWVRLLAMFVQPLVVVLLVIGAFSLFFGEPASAILVLAMAAFSVGLTFVQEYRSGRAAERLREMVHSTATVVRAGRIREVPMRTLVPGDVVMLASGDMTPADVRVVACKDLHVNQAALTGESFPAEKTAEPMPPAGKRPPAEAANMLFMGTSVASGSATAVVVRTGASTEFGELVRRMGDAAEPTGFDRGLRGFTWAMIRIMVVLVVCIFAIVLFTKRDVGFVGALLFALAVAVGLTPEMLPMLVAVNLSMGAIAMSRKRVIVKRLNAIQNVGAMEVLCTDKTGTLTEDRIVLEQWCDVVRHESADVLAYAYVNSYHQTGLRNTLDHAILQHEMPGLSPPRKVDEVPFDFSRRLMSVVVEEGGVHRLIAKGAPEEVFRRCTRYRLDGEVLEMEPLVLADLEEEVGRLSSSGFRVLAVGCRDFAGDAGRSSYTTADETDLTLMGYVAFLDPPKHTAAKALESLRKLGIRVKVLTGDNDLVTRKICGEVGIDASGLVTGEAVEGMDDARLREVADKTAVFARLSPRQKERVVRALRAEGRVVGFLGDGINDAPALKAADVGISVSNAVDIAKESADLILLAKSLAVLGEGVVEGRRTFGNIVKYIRMGASSNFGNMFSMTGASLFLPFLPMLPIQILANNFLYDLSQAAIPTDAVDEVFLTRPRPWDVKAIQRFMWWFGPLSSVFDYVTFGVLLLLFPSAADPTHAKFQTGWFLESICTQALVIHVMRTGRIPFVESRPSPLLLASSLAVCAAAILLVWGPMRAWFGFVAPPVWYLGVLAGIAATYLLSAQWLKGRFVRRWGYA